MAGKCTKLHHGKKTVERNGGKKAVRKKLSHPLLSNGMANPFEYYNMTMYL